MTHSPTPTELLALKTANAALLESKDSFCDMVATVVFALGSAQLLQSPETAGELVSLRTQVADLKSRWKDVGGIRRRRDQELRGRREFGDRMKQENADLRKALHEARKEVRAVRSWVSENTPFSGNVPGQVLRTLAWLRETSDIYQAWHRDDQVKGRKRLGELITARRRSDRLRLALKSAGRGRAALRARVAELEAERMAGWARYLSADERSSFLAELTVAASGMDETWAVENVRTVLAVWRGAADEGRVRGRRPLEDPYVSPLHQDHRISHDLPEVPHA